MKEHKFKGLDKKGNIKEGVTVFVLGILVIGISLYFFHDYIKTLFCCNIFYHISCIYNYKYLSFIHCEVFD